MSIDLDVLDLTEMTEGKVLVVRVQMGKMPHASSKKFMENVKTQMKQITDMVQETGGQVLFIPVHDHYAVSVSALEREAFDDIAKIVNKIDNYDNAMEIVK
jgi:hypothetical protein